jgi:hypothetical protein
MTPERFAKGMTLRGAGVWCGRRPWLIDTAPCIVMRVRDPWVWIGSQDGSGTERR